MRRNKWRKTDVVGKGVHRTRAGPYTGGAHQERPRWDLDQRPANRPSGTVVPPGDDEESTGSIRAAGLIKTEATRSGSPPANRPVPGSGGPARTDEEHFMNENPSPLDAWLRFVDDLLNREGPLPVADPSGSAVASHPGVT